MLMFREKSKIEIGIYTIFALIYFFFTIGIIVTLESTELKDLLWMGLTLFFLPWGTVIITWIFNSRGINTIDDPKDIGEKNIEKIVTIQTGELRGFTSYFTKIVYFFIDDIDLNIVIAHLFFPWILGTIVFMFSETSLFSIDFIKYVFFIVIFLFLPIKLIHNSIKKRYNISFKKYILNYFLYVLFNIFFIFIFSSILFAVLGGINIENLNLDFLKELLKEPILTEFFKLNFRLLDLYPGLIALNLCILWLSRDKRIKYYKVTIEEASNYLEVIKNKYRDYKKTHDGNLLNFLVFFSMKKDARENELYSLQNSLKDRFAIKRIISFNELSSASAIIIFSLWFIRKIYSENLDSITTNYFWTLDLIFSIIFFYTLVFVVLFFYLEKKFFQ